MNSSPAHLLSSSEEHSWWCENWDNYFDAGVHPVRTCAPAHRQLISAVGDALNRTSQSSTSDVSSQNSRRDRPIALDKGGPVEECFQRITRDSLQRAIYRGAPCAYFQVQS